MATLVEPVPLPVRQKRALWVSLVFVGSVVVALGSWVWPARDAEAQAFATALDEIRDDLRRGDTVYLHPPWRLDAMRALRDRSLPRGVEVSVALQPERGKPLRNAWLLVDEGAPDVSRAMRLRRNAQGAFVATVGPIRIERYAGEAPSTTGLLDLVSDARVEVESATGKVTRCRWDDAAARHVCPGLPDWMYVARTERTSGRDERACLWSHPTSGGVVRIAFADVAAPARARFFHAIADSGLRASNPSEVEARVIVDGKTRGTFRRGNDAGFREHPIALGGTGRAARDFVVEIRTENDGARHYCWGLAWEAEG